MAQNYNVLPWQDKVAISPEQEELGKRIAQDYLLKRIDLTGKQPDNSIKKYTSIYNDNPISYLPALPVEASTDMPYGMSRFNAQKDDRLPSGGFGGNAGGDLNGSLSYLGNLPVSQDIQSRSDVANLSTQGFSPLGLQGTTPTTFGDTAKSAVPMSKVSAPMSFAQLPKEQQAILLQQEQQQVWGNAPPQTQPGALGALPGVSEVSNVQSGRSAPDMSGKQYENVEYRVPGVTGYASGLRQVDPNRKPGTFSVMPGLSDAERQQAEQLRMKEERQAAYAAGNGQQYDTLLNQKMQIMASLGAAQMKAAQEQAKAAQEQNNADRTYKLDAANKAATQKLNWFREINKPGTPVNHFKQFTDFSATLLPTEQQNALSKYMEYQGFKTEPPENIKTYVTALEKDPKANVPQAFYDSVSNTLNVLQNGKYRQLNPFDGLRQRDDAIRLESNRAALPQWFPGK